jgi:hypothetical protein
MAEVAPFIQPSSDFRKLKLQTFDEPGGVRARALLSL